MGYSAWDRHRIPDLDHLIRGESAHIWDRALSARMAWVARCSSSPVMRALSDWFDDDFEGG